MTTEEAIKVLENAKSFYVTEAREAFDMAIEALQKQVPMKIKCRSILYPQCPACNSFAVGKIRCDECGQRIDWREKTQ